MRARSVGRAEAPQAIHNGFVAHEKARATRDMRQDRLNRQVDVVRKMSHCSEARRQFCRLLRRGAAVSVGKSANTSSHRREYRRRDAPRRPWRRRPRPAQMIAIWAIVNRSSVGPKSTHSPSTVGMWSSRTDPARGGFGQPFTDDLAVAMRGNQVCFFSERFWRRRHRQRATEPVRSPIAGFHFVLRSCIPSPNDRRSRTTRAAQIAPARPFRGWPMGKCASNVWRYWDVPAVDNSTCHELRLCVGEHRGDIEQVGF